MTNLADMLWRCTRRQHDVPIDQFTLKGNGRLHSWCKQCRCDAACEWQKRNRARKTAYQRAYRAS